ncbi:MAG TPA: hemerythrin domain-containing protein [Chitinophagaceae bacterium]
MKNNYGTVSQTIAALREEGYTIDFNVTGECLSCHKTNTVLSPEEFTIDAIYRFEGESNPDDEAIVYAISSPKYNVKGTLVNAYGPYADGGSDALVQKLQQKIPEQKDNGPRPLRRSKHILLLSKDHHFTLLFSWKIRQGLKLGIDPARIKTYVRHFWENDMQEHFREEEEILFKAVEDKRIVDKALSDHRHIEKEIAGLMASPTGEAASRQLAALADTVDRHVRYEERELFPELERVLTPGQLEEIGAALNECSVFRDEYEDEFWAPVIRR